MLNLHWVEVGFPNRSHLFLGGQVFRFFLLVFVFGGVLELGLPQARITIRHFWCLIVVLLQTAGAYEGLDPFNLGRSESSV